MNAFHWRNKPEEIKPEMVKPKSYPQEAIYPQKDYYWRKKAGLTGTRDNPDRHWRKKNEVPSLQPSA